MVIWSDMLPHSSTVNFEDQPRVVQYITMVPAGADQGERSQAVSQLLLMVDVWSLRVLLGGSCAPCACSLLTVFTVPLCKSQFAACCGQIGSDYGKAMLLEIASGTPASEHGQPCRTRAATGKQQRPQ